MRKIFQNQSMASSDSEKYLTEDLLMMNIFLRVDVKSIIRCTCVCKTWYHIIHNDSLVKYHLTYQKFSSNTNKYILHHNSKVCKLLTDCDPLLDSTKHSKLYYTPKLFEKDIDTCDEYRHLKIHGMCDGLLCFSVKADHDQYKIIYLRSDYYRIGDSLHLWNPICRKAKKLPQLEISYKRFIGNGAGVSFGYYGDDYKVIVISTCTGHEYIVSVYSLNSNCWNIIHTNCYYEEKILRILHPTKFIDGIAYMITATRMTSNSIPPLIVCFDLKDETIQQLKCPKEFVAYDRCYTIEAYGETIAVLGCSIGDSNSQHLAMWTLLRDKVSSKLRWEMKLVIKLPQVGYFNPVGFLYDGKYMISRYKIGSSTTFLLCDLESRKVTEYRSTDSHCCIIIPNCVESLLLLNEDSIDPFVHTEMESSCSSILFSLQKDILHPTKSTGTESERVSRGKKRVRG